MLRLLSYLLLDINSPDFRKISLPRIKIDTGALITDQLVNSISQLGFKTTHLGDFRAQVTNTINSYQQRHNRFIAYFNHDHHLTGATMDVGPVPPFTFTRSGTTVVTVTDEATMTAYLESITSRLSVDDALPIPTLFTLKSKPHGSYLINTTLNGYIAPEMNSLIDWCFSQPDKPTMPTCRRPTSFEYSVSSGGSSHENSNENEMDVSEKTPDYYYMTSAHKDNDNYIMTHDTSNITDYELFDLLLYNLIIDLHYPGRTNELDVDKISDDVICYLRSVHDNYVDILNENMYTKPINIDSVTTSEPMYKEYLTNRNLMFNDYQNRYNKYYGMYYTASLYETASINNLATPIIKKIFIDGIMEDDTNEYDIIGVGQTTNFHSPFQTQPPPLAPSQPQDNAYYTVNIKRKPDSMANNTPESPLAMDVNRVSEPSSVSEPSKKPKRRRHMTRRNPLIPKRGGTRNPRLFGCTRHKRKVGGTRKNKRRRTRKYNKYN